jgi:hypothetical protein
MKKELTIEELNILLEKFGYPPVSNVTFGGMGIGTF